MTQYSFISTKYRRNTLLVRSAFFLAFFVILLGAYTRLTDAGLSCPDWPNCYGFITAPHTPSQIQDAMLKYPQAPIDVKKAWTEMTHRYAAGTVGLLILFFSFSILLSPKTRGFKPTFIALALLGVLCLQVTLGMLTVTAKLKPVIVTGHLLMGLSLLSLLWWAYLDLHVHDDTFIQSPHSRSYMAWLWLGFGIVATQITLGGWVSSHYAGLACIDFPYCNTALIPVLHWDSLNTDLITIHMLHRLGAYITAMYVSTLAIFLLFDRSFRVNGLLMLALIIIQIALGILNIIWLRPVWIALLHQGVAITLLLTMITTLVKAGFNKGNRYGFFA